MAKTVSEKEVEKLLNQVPWYDNGTIIYSKYPIELPARDCCSTDPDKFRNGARMLMEMAAVGRKDAMFMFFGLFEYYKTDYKKLEVIVYSIPHSENEKFVHFLFDFFERTESSNSSRIFLNQMLQNLEYVNKEIAIQRFKQLLENPKYSHRMKAKFEEILYRIDSNME